MAVYVLHSLLMFQVIYLPQSYLDPQKTITNVIAVGDGTHKAAASLFPA